MKITVCIGSSCHVRGSRQVVEQLQDLIRDHNLSDEVELCGAFCMGQCQLGVCVKVDEEGTEQAINRRSREEHRVWKV